MPFAAASVQALGAAAASAGRIALRRAARKHAPAAALILRATASAAAAGAGFAALDDDDDDGDGDDPSLSPGIIVLIVLLIAAALVLGALFMRRLCVAGHGRGGPPGHRGAGSMLDEAFATSDEGGYDRDVEMGPVQASPQAAAYGGGAAQPQEGVPAAGGAGAGAGVAGRPLRLGPAGATDDEDDDDDDGAPEPRRGVVKEGAE